MRLVSVGYILQLPHGFHSFWYSLYTTSCFQILDFHNSPEKVLISRGKTHKKKKKKKKKEKKKATRTWRHQTNQFDHTVTPCIIHNFTN